MKRFLLIVTTIAITQNLLAQTLFTFGNKQVSKAEFLKAYNKNPSPNETDRKQALREYLNLYINYKLKVQAAFDEKLHQQANFIFESNNFKKQIAENIINNEANINELVQEAFERSQKDIQVAQVFIEIKTGVNEVEANKQIQKAYEALKQGANFSDVATNFSNDDDTKKTKGDLGFITVFTLPYEFENEIYKLKNGEYSAPYKSSIGYHIFKNVQERPAAGKRKLAQILITVPKDASEETIKKFAITADTVYQKAKRGVAFENLVQEYSTDRTSLGNNGVLAELSVGQYDPNFEEHAFALNKIEEIGKPFLTQHGWHILKLVEVTLISKNFNDPVTNALIRQQIERADRLTVAKKGLTRKWLNICNFKPGVFDEKEFLIFTDSAIKGGGLNTFIKVTPATVLFSFTKQKITAGDWSKFVKAIKQSGSPLASKATIPLLREYEQIVCGEYYRDHLEDFNISLKEQSKEFDEANLLFSAMDKYVWGKANTDSAGLINHYNINKAKYNWAPGISALVITTTSQETANEVIDSLQKNAANWRLWVGNYGNAVIADSNRFENNQLPIVQKVENKVGFISKPEKNESDGSYTFIYISALHNIAETRNFDDARGMVTNDYQQVLEKRWLDILKKKYPVKINEVVWSSVK